MEKLQEYQVELNKMFRLIDAPDFLRCQGRAQLLQEIIDTINLPEGGPIEEE